MRPRLGFLGTGWIGRHRLDALAASGVAEIVAITDPVAANAEAAAAAAPGAELVPSFEELLDRPLDGLVIATPSALHATQARMALARGLAVFCQKPLARTAEETASVLEVARSRDRLLDVDLSYREVEAARRARELVRDGSLGPVFAADLVFHNAYGPDKAWFYDPTLSGGGCVIDLGIHLVDLALWTLDFPAVRGVSSRLIARGQPVEPGAEVVEDYAIATLDLESGTTLRLACSWNLSAGCDAVIGTDFHGTKGSVSMRNVNGSFYDFTALLARGTTRTTLTEPPDDWGGRAAVKWARRLAENRRYDPAADRLLDLAGAIDAIYGRGAEVLAP
jgi:predicted dehydrogenase